MLDVVPTATACPDSPLKRRRSGLMVDEAQSSIEPTTEEHIDNIKVVVIHGDPNKFNSVLPGGTWSEYDHDLLVVTKKALNEIPGYSFTFLSNHDTLLDDLRKLKSSSNVDLVLQFCDEGWENHYRMELHICAYLEMLHIPYTGSGPACIGITLDKQTVMGMAAAIGIPVPKTVFLETEKNGIDLKGLKFPVLVKPNSADGSYGITKKNVCHSEAQLLDAIKDIREIFNIHGPLLIQEYLEGRDLNCAIIGNPPHAHTVLPITEEDYSALPAGWPKICGFESKWDPESPYWQLQSVPTTLSKEKQQIIIDCSARLFHRLGARDYARFDWRLNADGDPYLLEANPNCGWSADGHMAKVCNLAGLSYSEMLHMIIRAARFRQTLAKEPTLKCVELSLVRDL